MKHLKIILATLWLGLLLMTLVLWRRLQLILSSIPARLEQGMRNFGLYKEAAVYILLCVIRQYKA